MLSDRLHRKRAFFSVYLEALKASSIFCDLSLRRIVSCIWLRYSLNTIYYIKHHIKYFIKISCKILYSQISKRTSNNTLAKTISGDLSQKCAPVSYNYFDLIRMNTFQSAPHIRDVSHNNSELCTPLNIH